MPNLVPIIPEIIMLSTVCLTLLISLMVHRWKHVAYYLSQFALLVTAVFVWAVYFYGDGGKAILNFHNMFILDWLAVILKISVLVMVFFTFLFSRYYNDERHIPAPEFYMLGLLSTIGMLILISSHNLLTIFLGVELLSLPTYAMVALERHQSERIEAAMKYFVIGAIASGMLLYGMSMIFGATQNLDIDLIAKAIANTSTANNLILIFGLVFIVAGIVFKLGAAPFHMWVPDVYQGAPTSVTLFISTAPKIAGFGMAIRLLVGALPALHVQWQEMLIVVSVLSMGIGNFAAIAQSNIKRMLAYSSIAHIGYMLLGLICVTSRGYTAAMFYIISYSVITLGAFGMLLLMSRSGLEVENIDDFSGLGRSNPWLAFMMLIIMFSLAGVPPLVGFIAKVGVLEALIQVHLVWLAVVALLFAIIGSYYYLRVIKVIFFDVTEYELQAIPYPIDLKCAITISGLAIFGIGIFPGLLFALCRLAF